MSTQLSMESEPKAPIISSSERSSGDVEAHNNAHVVTAKPADETPDGGLIAWTQVIMGHLVIFNCWGYITSCVQLSLTVLPFP